MSIPTANKPFTIQDVARIAGVSAMTVSRALNTPQKVAPDTLARVQQAVAQTHFVPNAMASGLRRSRARLVAALLPTLVGPVFQEMVEALDRSLHDRGYQLMIGQSGYDQAREDDLLRATIQRRPDGIVVTGVVRSEEGRRALRASGIPVVETWELTATPVDMLVGFSHAQIGAAVVDYLHQRGHRHIAMVSADDQRALTRIEAFDAQVASLGLSRIAPAFTRPPSTMGSGRQGLRELLARNPEVTAVFCSSDMLALGASIEARELGLQVPAQLAIVGLGDQGVAADASPPLTTVRIDGTQIGRLAADMVVARAEGGSVSPSVVDLGFSIIQRQSS
ncbi:LacI family DNA-binding transcriptional regulator [Xenophilus arseniciresistens]|uniref:LacI family DNA-binding transcriptional regulator n=1 Tax=Xenophilus arseniciresistens TaxID=1283306 RepID=A0AAE3SZI7_9BURK|nr:LacI family DNA-binding transcriptional regulator [Xenophilus arseniciresistens]MDA7415267.1 LacI family DNA-binding transcriptional regulator [Xenophilus arseniciresistens]